MIEGYMDIIPTSSLQTTSAKKSVEVNNTRFRRILLLVRLRLYSRYLLRHGPVLMLSKDLCVKIGNLKSPAEAATLRFVAQNTSIPVPKVHLAFERNGTEYILMDRMPGKILRIGWLKRSSETKEKILAQLRGMVDQWRRIPAPSDQVISNVAGGPLFDGRLAQGSYHGPFNTIQDFHRHLREDYDGELEELPDANMLVEWHKQYRGKPVFTHGDLNTMNIMVEGDKVVGTIDWETAGWWPEYWEYCSAWHVNPYDEFWRQEVDKFIEPMPKELGMEKVRRKYFADIPYR